MDTQKKIKFILIASAFAVLILIVLTNVFKMTRVSEKDLKAYNQGLQYVRQGDFENAYYNFSNVSKTSGIYEIALLRQAMSADKLNDAQTAAKKYRMFIEKYPESVFIEKAYYSLAQNCFKEKDFNRAEKTFNDIKKLFKDSDYAKASDYYLGLIQKEKIKENDIEKDILSKKIKAKEFFIQYLAATPDGRFSTECINEIASLGLPITPYEYFLIGQTCFKTGQYERAFNNLNLSDIRLAWGYLSILYTKRQEYVKAREIFEANYIKYSKNMEPEDLNKVLENYASLSPIGMKDGWYKALSLAQSYGAYGEDFILYRLAKLVSGEEKSRLNRLIFTQHSDGQYAGDAVANLFWAAYKRGDYQEAKMLGNIHARDYANTNSAPKVLFWTAKIAAKEGRKNDARALYQRVVSKYPDSYYAYRANKSLAHGQSESWRTRTTHKLPEKTLFTEFPAKYTKVTDDNLSVIDTILKLNDFKLIQEIDENNKALLSWIKYKEGEYTTSAVLARDFIDSLEQKPDFEDSLYKLAYPLHYQDIVNNTSRLYKLDPYLVISIIREESYFNPNARSIAGATGLMQIMPSTARYITNQKGIPYNGVSSLYKPATNINIGCSYLNYVKSTLHNDDLLVVASYNGGPNAVENWKNNLDYSNFDEFVENIPYPETAEYIKKVFRSYWVYTNVY